MSRNLIRSITTSIRRSNYSTRNVSSSLPPTEKLIWRSGEDSMIEEFQRRAFIPQTPILITSEDPAKGILDGVLPAAEKWFKTCGKTGNPDVVLDYLGKFGDTILPYELILPPNPDPESRWSKEHEAENISKIPALSFQTETKPEKLPGSISFEQLKEAIDNLYIHTSPIPTFHRFHAPLSLLLSASMFQILGSKLKNLYIAQAQLIDLPPQLRNDLPTPSLVLKAGKGDIYDSNLWLGIPPTYTPLHADPNPNLFVQLAGRKRVRLFPGEVGKGMLARVREVVGGGGGGRFRGEEMMEGGEREVLDGLVWGVDAGGSGMGREVVVESGEGLFIPKGWWHCVVSEGEGVNGSVNWWFR